MIHTTFARLALVVAGLAAVQALVFAYYYEDLLFLRQPVDIVVAVPSDEFNGHAASALQRSRLTRDHLETLAGASQRRGETDIEVRALRRLTLDHPNDKSIALRRADALRRARYFDEAETVYLQILQDSK